MASIQPSLEWNKQVPNTSLCTLPEALVQIPTPLGVVCHRSQYHIADSLYNMVKDNIKLWLEDGTIVEIPANADNSWNNPLALAPKEIANGKYTRKRPCLDPRLINQHLPDDRHRIPLIGDIYEKLASAAVYNTLDLASTFTRFSD